MTARLHHGSERLFSPGIGQSASNTNLNTRIQTETCTKFCTDDNASIGINVIKEEGKRKSIKKQSKFSKAASNLAFCSDLDKDKRNRAVSNGGGISFPSREG